MGMAMNQRSDWELSFLHPHSIKPAVYMVLIIANTVIYSVLYLITAYIQNKRSISPDENGDDLNQDFSSAKYHENFVNPDGLKKIGHISNL